MDERFYERYAQLEDGHWWFRARRDVVRACLDRYLDGAEGTRTILDVGCGTGAMVERVLNGYGTTCAVDSDLRAVSRARQRGVDAGHVPGLPETPLPFGDESFDVVSAFDVLEHVDDDVGLAREMTRVCRPGGVIVVTVPAFPSLWGRQDLVSHHKRRYTRARLVATLRGSNLRVEHCTFFNAFLFPAVATIRLARRPSLRKRPYGVPHRSDFETGPSGPGSELLYRVMSAEQRLVTRMKLPFGVSLLAICEKPPR